MFAPGVRPNQAERKFVLSVLLIEGGHGPFRGLVAPLRARFNTGPGKGRRQPQFNALEAKEAAVLKTLHSIKTGNGQGDICIGESKHAARTGNGLVDGNPVCVGQCILECY